MVPSFRFFLDKCALAIALALCASVAHAEQSTRAARLLSFEGTTQVFGATESQDQAGDVQVNMPLLEGVQLRTADDGRSEVEFEDGSIARLTPNSQLSLDSLSERSTEIGVVQGLAYFELREKTPYPYSVRYGSNLIRLVTDSTFRVNLDTSPGELSVFAGEVVVANGDRKIIVRANETLRFVEESADGYVVDSSITPDSWDQWNDEQDAAAAVNTQQGDVANGSGDGATSGWSDLNTYGDWYDVPDVGTVWQPADAGADFNPYTLGSWGWYPGFGYTWISGYAWGWTPFHCGGWNYFDGFGWGWVPGSCYGWETGVHFRHPPFGFRPPSKPAEPPLKVIRVKHPIVHAPLVTPGNPVMPARPTPPVHRTSPVLLNGIVVSPLPRRPIITHEAGGDIDSPDRGADHGGGRMLTRGTYLPAAPIRPTGGGAPIRVSPPARVSEPIVLRPAAPAMPVAPVHSSPSPVMQPSAPHPTSAPAAVAPSHK